ncbi:MAG: hypothetical protein CM1200mP30_15470 [Pseudomonadota bacterium]|nr:MAG: hypothetical protein CM1200mP30_15470 [Pseudomonadota bacterium]
MAANAAFNKSWENPAVDLYIRNQRKKAEQVELYLKKSNFQKNFLKCTLAAIASFNFDPKVPGIILQRPVPENIPIKSLQKAIHPFKDVEGMHPGSIGELFTMNWEMGHARNGFRGIVETHW